jgi:hypothetical protein
MMTAADLPGTIPVFPLPGALMLPRARLPLHIFEPRYLAMLDDTMKTSHRLIGMVQPREVPGSGEKRLHSIGCAGRLTQFSETEDGRYMITLRHLAVSRAAGDDGLHALSPLRRELGGVLGRSLRGPSTTRIRPRGSSTFWAGISRRCRCPPTGTA